MALASALHPSCYQRPLQRLVAHLAALSAAVPCHRGCVNDAS